MRHMKSTKKFNRDHSARKALLVNLSKSLIEREQIKTTLPKAKTLRGIVEKLITRAKVDSVANRRLVAAELGNGGGDAVKKLFTVLGPRYAKRPGGYTRVLRAGFRYGDTAPMAIIELIDRDAGAKGLQKSTEHKTRGADKAGEKKVADRSVTKSEKKAPMSKPEREAKTTAPKKSGAAKTVAVKRRATGS